MQTHNVLPDDPREIYPNALHAAVRHPNPAKAAMAIKKAEFLKNHQDSVSAAAEELLAALAKDAREAEHSIKAAMKQEKDKKQQSQDTKETKEAAVEVVRRNQISNPMSDPSLTMWDLLAWPGSTFQEEKGSAAITAVAVATEKGTTTTTTKRVARKKTDLAPTQPVQVLVFERNNKPSPMGRRRIVATSAGLKKVTIEEIQAFEKFEPQQIEMVDPKAYGNLGPGWTRNIPTAGKKSPKREGIPL